MFSLILHPFWDDIKTLIVHLKFNFRCRHMEHLGLVRNSFAIWMNIFGFFYIYIYSQESRIGWSDGGQQKRNCLPIRDCWWRKNKEEKVGVESWVKVNYHFSLLVKKNIVYIKAKLFKSVIYNDPLNSSWFYIIFSLCNSLVCLKNYFWNLKIYIYIYIW